MSSAAANGALLIVDMRNDVCPGGALAARAGATRAGELVAGDGDRSLAELRAAGVEVVPWAHAA